MISFADGMHGFHGHSTRLLSRLRLRLCGLVDSFISPRRLHSLLRRLLERLGNFLARRFGHLLLDDRLRLCFLFQWYRMYMR